MRAMQAHPFISNCGREKMSIQPEAQGELDQLERLIDELRCFVKEEAPIPIGPNSVEKRSVFLCRILQDLLSGLKDTESPSHSMAKRIHTFMIAHLHRGPTLKDLSLFLGYSEKYGSQLFHTVVGKSFSLYLKTIRVERAKVLLEEGRVSLTEIATILGFSDQFAFSHFFKKAVGCSPTNYRTPFQDMVDTPSKPPCQ